MSALSITLDVKLFCFAVKDCHSLCKKTVIVKHCLKSYEGLFPILLPKAV